MRRSRTILQGFWIFSIFFLFNKLLRNSLNFEVGIYEIMTAEHISKKFPEKGLPIGTEAPLFETTDIFGDDVDLKKILGENDFILIDLFRGAW